MCPKGVAHDLTHKNHASCSIGGTERPTRKACLHRHESSDVCCLKAILKRKARSTLAVTVVL